MERGDDDDDDDGAAVVDIAVVAIDVVENFDADLMMEILSSLVRLCSRFGPKSGRHRATLFS